MCAPLKLIKYLLAQRAEHVLTIGLWVFLMRSVAGMAEGIKVEQIKLCRRHGSVPEVAALKHLPVVLSAQNTERSAEPGDHRCQVLQLEFYGALSIFPR